MLTNTTPFLTAPTVEQLMPSTTQGALVSSTDSDSRDHRVQHWHESLFDQTLIPQRTALDELRLRAQVSGLRNGETGIEYCNGQGDWSPWPWLGDAQPVAARVYVSRSDSDTAFEGVAEWRDGFGTFPHSPYGLGQLALVNAYAAAFPELLRQPQPQAE